MRQPALSHFRIEAGPEGILHLVFDVPERRFNILSNAAIAELDDFVSWLPASGARGVVIRSGKANAFCVGSDLVELGDGYDRVMAEPPAQRDKSAFSLFFRLSSTLRALETIGIPVVAAVAGPTLGGGSELVLACHHRILVDEPATHVGQPESLVGLMPGAGGTQRLPRLIGLARALPILQHGDQLGAEEALAAGYADQLVRPGEEIAAAESWILRSTEVRQPWDGQIEPDQLTPAAATIIDDALRALKDEPSTHMPAQRAILEAVRLGMQQPMDQAIRTEMVIFSSLIQRPEPRNTIRVQFFGKLAYEKRMRSGSALPEVEALAALGAKALLRTCETARDAGYSAAQVEQALRYAGFTKTVEQLTAETGGSDAIEEGDAVAPLDGGDYWFQQPQADRRDALAAILIMAVIRACGQEAMSISETALPSIDYGIAARLGFPTYLGGPLQVATDLQHLKNAH